MRTTFAVAAGLVAVASAGTTTITDTVDVTITSCAPSVTNCPYKGGNGGDPTWSDWSVSASTTSSKPVSPVSSSTWDPTWSDWVSSTSTKPVSPDSTGSWDPTWSDWTGTATTTTSKPVSPATTPAACGAYTATAPPAWFSLLPTDSYSSLQAKWSGAPPSDWCYYTYSASSLITTATPVSPATGTWGSVPVAAASTSSAAWASYGGSATGVSPATFTGAANANTGSFALVGLAAAAALVMA